MTSTSAVLQSLQDVSKGTAIEDAQTAAYNSTVDRIKSSKQKDLAGRAIACAMACYRPLGVEELRHAVSIKSSTKDINNHDLDNLQAILNACAGLLQVNKFTNVIQLAHYTTQQYFEGLEDPEWFDLYRNYLGEACLNYLSMDGLIEEIIFHERNAPPSSPHTRHRKSSPTWREKLLGTVDDGIIEPHSPMEVLHFYPLASYALEFWSWHIRCMAPQASSLETLSFLRKKEVAAWIVYFHPGHIGRIMFDQAGAEGFRRAQTASTDDLEHLKILRDFIAEKEYPVHRDISSLIWSAMARNIVDDTASTSDSDE